MKVIHVRPMADMEGFRAELAAELGEVFLYLTWWGAERSTDVYLSDKATADQQAAVHSVRDNFKDAGEIKPISTEGRVTALEHEVAALRQIIAARVQPITAPEPPKGWTPPTNVSPGIITTADDLNKKSKKALP